MNATTLLSLIEQVQVIDTDDIPAIDTGSKGKKFEDILLKAFSLVGLTFKTNTVRGKMWDVHPQGDDWINFLGEKDINIKIVSTKWLFGTSKIGQMLPWDDIPDDFDEAPAIKKIKKFLNTKGVADVLYLKPKTIEIQSAIVKATEAEDVAKLNTLLSKKNFSVAKLGRSYGVTLNRKGNRFTSVVIHKDGKVFMRSERPRKVGKSSAFVAFKLPAPTATSSKLRKIKEGVTMNSKESFRQGYEAVKSGKIKKELTNREIEKRWPKVDSQAFAQGMLDALKGDSWRYKRESMDENLKPIANAEEFLRNVGLGTNSRAGNILDAVNQFCESTKIGKFTLDKSPERLAMEIKGKDRKDAEKHLQKYGIPIAVAAAIVTTVTGSRSQKVIEEVPSIAAEITRQLKNESLEEKRSTPLERPLMVMSKQLLDVLSSDVTGIDQRWISDRIEKITGKYFSEIVKVYKDTKNTRNYVGPEDAHLFYLNLVKVGVVLKKQHIAKIAKLFKEVELRKAKMLTTNRNAILPKV